MSNRHTDYLTVIRYMESAETMQQAFIADRIRTRFNLTHAGDVRHDPFCEDLRVACSKMYQRITGVVIE